MTERQKYTPDARDSLAINQTINTFIRSITLAVNNPPKYFPSTPDLRRDFYQSSPDKYLTPNLNSNYQELYKQLKNNSFFLPDVMNVIKNSDYARDRGHRFPRDYFPYLYIAHDHDTSLWTYLHKGYSSHFGRNVWQSYLYCSYDNENFHRQLSKDILNGIIPVKEFVNTLSQKVFRENKRIGPILSEPESNFTVFACEYQRKVKLEPKIMKNAAKVKVF